jgi:hypothetical protein
MADANAEHIIPYVFIRAIRGQNSFPAFAMIAAAKSGPGHA